MPRIPKKIRFAWALTGSGHDLEECLEFLMGLEDVDVFLSRAVEEVLVMYKYTERLRRAKIRMFRDSTASAVPVGQFYENNYHTLVVAPATSNTVAKCVAGISDTLVTNVFAQAGKCKIPIIVYACDTKPVVITPAPGQMVTVYPREIDLECSRKIGEFESTTLTTNMDELISAVLDRIKCLNESCS